MSKPSFARKICGPQGLVDFERPHKLDSAGSFPFPEHYLRIENDQVSAEEAANRICRHFGLDG